MCVCVCGGWRGYRFVRDTGVIFNTLISIIGWKRTGRSHMSRKGSDRFLKILCTFKSPFTISWLLLFVVVGVGGGATVKQPNITLHHSIGSLRIFITVWPFSEQENCSKWKKNRNYIQEQIQSSGCVSRCVYGDERPHYLMGVFFFFQLQICRIKKN